MNGHPARDNDRKSGRIAALSNDNEPNGGNTPQQTPRKRKLQVDDDELVKFVKYVRKIGPA